MKHNDTGPEIWYSANVNIFHSAINMDHLTMVYSEAHWSARLNVGCLSNKGKLKSFLFAQQQN